MVEFNRKEIKEDPTLTELHKRIKENHKIADHTISHLINNKEVKNFCEEARHFMTLGEVDPIFMYYDVHSWYSNGKALVSIRSIGVYENYGEFAEARLKAGL